MDGPNRDGIVRRRIRFKDAETKARWLAGAAGMDATTKQVADLAQAIAGSAPDQMTAANLLFHWVREAIAYLPDPGGEQFADTMTIVKRRFDDCDGMARTFVALCKALARRSPLLRGLRATIVPVFKGPSFVHVQARVRGDDGSISRHPLARPQDGSLLCELTVRGCQIGDGTEAAERDPRTGRPVYV